MSSAAPLPFLPRQKGAFEVDPKDAIVVGDVTAEASKAARAEVEKLQNQAKEALAKLDKNPQEDLSPYVERFGLADLRTATNVIGELMDPPTAAGVQRLQRLMIMSKFRLEDDIPFPTNKRGERLSRGEKRLERIQACLKDYIKNGDELLKFF